MILCVNQRFYENPLRIFEKIIFHYFVKTVFASFCQSQNFSKNFNMFLERSQFCSAVEYLTSFGKSWVIFMEMSE